MPILTSATSFVVTTKKNPSGFDGFTWVNRYHLQRAGGTLTPESFDNIADSFRLYEVAIHNELVNFQSVTISTYPEEDITNPDRFKSFVTYDYNELCLRDQPGDALDAQFVVNVKLQTELGRSGLKQYRGVLGEGDVTTGQALKGYFPPSTKTAMNILMDINFTLLQSTLEEISETLQIAIFSHLSPTEFIARRVTSVNVAKPSIRQIDNAWFDRA
jgi:hypothetical protein